MDKEKLRLAIIERLRDDLAVQAGAARDSHAEATSEESKAEHQYDMRGQEAAYLAEGQARLAAELAESIALYQSFALPNLGPQAAITLGAAVALQGRGAPVWYFLGPRNGGLDLAVGDQSVTVITPHSPLGRQLMGQRLGNLIQLPGRGGPIPHRIVGIV